MLGDTATRDYSRKLQSFNRFAEPELRQAVDSLALQTGMRVLDAGCGTGEALRWLAEKVGPNGSVTGVELSAAHAALARSDAPANVRVIEADLREAELRSSSVDVVWCVNTINHFRDPLAVLGKLKASLARGGQIALGQSSLLPDMCFAWDARLERLVNEAVRRYYRDRYGLEERDLSPVRALVGLLRQAGFRDVRAKTFAIDRLSPLDATSKDYILETLFQNTWGERLRPYVTTEDYESLARLCDPGDGAFALKRPDFHFIQTLTFVTGAT